MNNTHSRRKKLLIEAFALNNLGDDLFVKILCERYPDQMFYIICDLRFSIAFKKIPNLTVIPRIPLIDGVLRRLNVKFRINGLLYNVVSHFSNGAIHIGGSIFIESESWKDAVYQYNKKVKKDKPYFIMGSNFGPYSNTAFVDNYRSIFTKVTDVCFRDTYSHNIFSELKNIRVESDIVFSYPTEKKDIRSRNQVLISVIDLANRKNLKKHNEIYINKMVELVKCLILNGYNVLLMGFCTEQDDNKTINNIFNGIDDEFKKNIGIHLYKGDIDKSLKLIQESKYVIGTRFHSIILGFLFEKPVYPIVYSDKSKNVLNDMGFRGEYLEIQDMSNLNPKGILNYLENNVPINIGSHIKSANNQFKILDEFLL